VFTFVDSALGGVVRICPEVTMLPTPFFEVTLCVFMKLNEK
jgi:hypothetical protein